MTGVTMSRFGIRSMALAVPANGGHGTQSQPHTAKIIDCDNGKSDAATVPVLSDRPGENFR